MIKMARRRRVRSKHDIASVSPGPKSDPLAKRQRTRRDPASLASCLIRSGGSEPESFMIFKIKSTLRQQRVWHPSQYYTGVVRHTAISSAIRSLRRLHREGGKWSTEPFRLRPSSATPRRDNGLVQTARCTPLLPCPRTAALCSYT